MGRSVSSHIVGTAMLDWTIQLLLDLRLKLPYTNVMDCRELRWGDWRGPDHERAERRWAELVIHLRVDLVLSVFQSNHGIFRGY